jgi:hypothetical protein
VLQLRTNSCGWNTWRIVFACTCPFRTMVTLHLRWTICPRFVHWRIFPFDMTHTFMATAKMTSIHCPKWWSIEYIFHESMSHHSSHFAGLISKTDSIVFQTRNNYFNQRTTTTKEQYYLLNIALCIFCCSIFSNYSTCLKLKTNIIFFSRSFPNFYGLYVIYILHYFRK